MIDEASTPDRDSFSKLRGENLHRVKTVHRTSSLRHQQRQKTYLVVKLIERHTLKAVKY
jgi:hypothetical protein